MDNRKYRPGNIPPKSYRIIKENSKTEKLIVIVAMALCILFAVSANLTSFLNDAKTTLLGFISTLLYFFLWFMLMFYLKHRNPLLLCSLIIHSAIVLTFIIQLIYNYFDMGYSLLTLIVLPWFVVYDGFSYFPQLCRSHILEFIIIIQEGICIFLYIRKKKRNCTVDN